MQAWRLKIELWMVYRPADADSHNFDEEQHPDPHLGEKLDPDPDLLKSDADPQP
jgi:hypothetical protein